MASSLFDLSVAWRLPMRLQLQPHPIDDCVEQALHELAFLTEEKGISVTVQLAPSPGSTLWFDSTRVGQVLVNLLDNACRFTPKYGSIEIFGYPYFWERRSPSNLRVAMERRKRKCEEPNSYRLNMTDTGPEIPETFLPLLFEEYTSYSGPADRSGAGLGLAICRTIARAHQGDIWVVSETGGVTFSVVLPFQLADSQLMDRPPHDMRVTADRL
jgi:signal transduction histidine kinase